MIGCCLIDIQRIEPLCQEESRPHLTEALSKTINDRPSRVGRANHRYNG